MERWGGGGAAADNLEVAANRPMPPAASAVRCTNSRRVVLLSLCFIGNCLSKVNLRFSIRIAGVYLGFRFRRKRLSCTYWESGLLNWEVVRRFFLVDSFKVWWTMPETLSADTITGLMKRFRKGDRDAVE